MQGPNKNNRTPLELIASQTAVVAEFIWHSKNEPDILLIKSRANKENEPLVLTYLPSTIPLPSNRIKAHSLNFAYVVFALTIT